MREGEEREREKSSVSSKVTPNLKGSCQKNVWPMREAEERNSTRMGRKEKEIRSERKREACGERAKGE